MIEQCPPYQAESTIPLPTAERHAVTRVSEHPSPAPSLQGEPSVSGMQITTINPSLVALETHPDFQRGVAFGREAYYEEYEGRLSEEEMITLVEGELSRRARGRDARLGELCPFLLHLGVVIGVIDEALVVNAQ